MWRVNSALIFVLLGAMALNAQTTPTDDLRFPIQSVKFAGISRYSHEQVLAASGLAIGMPADRAVFEAAQRRLVDTGAFESVGFQYGPSADAKGYDATYEIAEIAQVYPYRLTNLDADEAAVRAWLKQKEPLFGDEIPGTEEIIGRFSRHIRAYLDSLGKSEPVRGEIFLDRPGELYVLFHPARAMPVVAEVDFTGNEVIPTSALREAINGVAIGSRYTESRFQLLLDSSVRPVYESRGRLNVAFPKLTAVPVGGDVNGLKVTVEVSEGDSYNLGNIFVEGSASMNLELAGTAALKSGELASFKEVGEGVARVNNALRAKGYMKAATTVERTLREEQKLVDLILRVETGPQYKFGKLTVEGLDLNGEFEVRRIWGLSAGDPFIGDYPDFFLSRVKEDGVFDNLREARSRIDLDDKALVANVTLLFNPPPVKKLPSTFDDTLSNR